jgi:hypothetical protein
VSPLRCTELTWNELNSRELLQLFHKRVIFREISMDFPGDLGLRRQLRGYQNRKMGLDISIERKKRADQATRTAHFPAFSPSDSVRTDANTNRYTLFVICKMSKKSRTKASYACFAKYGTFIWPRKIEKVESWKLCVSNLKCWNFFTQEEPLWCYNFCISVIESYSDVAKVTWRWKRHMFPREREAAEEGS